MQPKLALTLGDPAGIGSEVLLKALADPNIQQQCTLTIIGNQGLLEQAYLELRAKTSEPLIDPANLEIIDPVGNPGEKIEWGQGSPLTGDLSFKYLSAAIEATLSGEFSGIVTAPIAKIHWHEAGHFYPGQTEVLAQKSKTDRYGMAFIGRSPHTGWVLRSLLATTHIPLADVPTALTPELMDLKLDLLLVYSTARTCRKSRLLHGQIKSN